MIYCVMIKQYMSVDTDLTMAPPLIAVFNPAADISLMSFLVASAIKSLDCFPAVFSEKTVKIP